MGLLYFYKTFGSHLSIKQMTPIESVWKRYNDFMGVTATQYLKIEYDNQYIHLSAWISDERSTAESDLNGVLGMLPKKKLKKIIEEIENSI